MMPTPAELIEERTRVPLEEGPSRTIIRDLALIASSRVSQRDIQMAVERNIGVIGRLDPVAKFLDAVTRELDDEGLL